MKRLARRRVCLAVPLLISAAGILLLAASAFGSTKETPSNTVQPSISGTAAVGEELTANQGTWTNGPTAYGYQWQRCTTAGCSDISGATGKSYGVRTADAGNTLRVAVTATNASGSATAYSDRTRTVPQPSGSTTTVVTTTSRTNHAPTLAFLSIRRVGLLIYVRFRVCDDSTARVKVTERDTKPGVLAYTRRYAVSGRPCATYPRHWGLAARFRHGRYTATLQARDRQGATSPVRSRTLVFR
jgi:hypothetical protein